MVDLFELAEAIVASASTNASTKKWGRVRDAPNKTVRVQGAFHF